MLVTEDRIQWCAAVLEMEIRSYGILHKSKTRIYYQKNGKK
jgi:hypothetical protein